MAATLLPCENLHSLAVAQKLRSHEFGAAEDYFFIRLAYADDAIESKGAVRHARLPQRNFSIHRLGES
jgi:hypothetical protein